jgi:hypothetical protein
MISPMGGLSPVGQLETIPALSRMAAVGSRPDVERRWSELPFLASSGLRRLSSKQFQSIAALT